MTRELPGKVFQDNEPPPRRTSFIVKLLGLVVILAAAYLGWYVYRTGSVPDLTDKRQQEKLIEQAKRDFNKAEEKATVYGEKAVDAMGKAADWAAKGLEDVRKRIKGNPPETKEEVSALVKDSGATVPPPKHVAPVETARAADKNPWDAPLQEAWNSFYRGVAEHSKSSPDNSREQVQTALREATPHFERTLNLLEEVRAKGGKGSEIDELENRTAKRLYDCKKRRSVTVGSVRTP